jgi:hypothetical protein
MEIFDATLGMTATDFSSALKWLLTAAAIIFSVLCIKGMYSEILGGNMTFLDAILRITMLMATLTFLSVIYLS